MQFSIRQLLFETKTWDTLNTRKHKYILISKQHDFWMLTRIFGPRDEVSGEWKKLHNEELNDLYSSPTTVRVIKSRRMRWAGHAAHMGEGRGVYRVLVEKLRERDHWGNPSVDGRIILRRIFRKWDVGVWTGLSSLRIGTGAGQL
jgi:hypothetical protein